MWSILTPDALLDELHDLVPGGAYSRLVELAEVKAAATEEADTLRAQANDLSDQLDYARRRLNEAEGEILELEDRLADAISEREDFAGRLDAALDKIEELTP